MGTQKNKGGLRNSEQTHKTRGPGTTRHTPLLQGRPYVHNSLSARRRKQASMGRDGGCRDIPWGYKILVMGASQTEAQTQRIAHNHLSTSRHMGFNDTTLRSEQELGNVNPITKPTRCKPLFRPPPMDFAMMHTNQALIMRAN
ncbi:Hypothetical predicted protein [Pelobates cultripes]|uniref:Uncharacterized protein n=1 Tax=Pelobates cultripes TaxID=61616 RepID=A0AAD1WVA7_PELCU|nr:Hypothetical predicted protein [Pelobates cultripes]